MTLPKRPNWGEAPVTPNRTSGTGLAGEARDSIGGCSWFPVGGGVGGAAVGVDGTVTGVATGSDTGVGAGAGAGGSASMRGCEGKTGARSGAPGAVVAKSSDEAVSLSHDTV